MDLSGFPKGQKGAYVIRFEKKQIHRLLGSSSVIKIGKAGTSFHERFRQYNNKNESSIYSGNTWCFFDDYRVAVTDYELMWRLPKLLELDSIVIDFFHAEAAGKTPRDLEKLLLCIYLDEHGETPPLNRSLF